LIGHRHQQRFNTKNKKASLPLARCAQPRILKIKIKSKGTFTPAFHLFFLFVLELVLVHYSDFYKNTNPTSLARGPWFYG